MQYSLKYRPRTFSEFVGQAAVKTELQNRSMDMTFPQAMIFSGETGVGKTTLAFIVAKLLNCKNPTTDSEGVREPCNECNSCRSVDNETFNLDISFFDSSKLLKENLLDIEQMVSVYPMHSKNKVIIIEEAQELLKSSSSLFLKMLEKPRPYVYFIFTTMNVQKIHKAIIGRCQHYKMRTIKTSNIAEHLFSIVEKENIQAPDIFFQEGLVTIADNANGSIRDALQYLERVVYGKYWDKESILKELNLTSTEDIYEALYQVVFKDKKVFSNLLNLDLQKLFYVGRKILTEAYVYKVSGVHLNKSYQRQNEKLANSDNLDNVFLNFEELSKSLSYFQETAVIGMLARCFTESAVSSRKRVAKRKPVS